MKKIYGLMALAMGLATLVSCSDDDNKEPANDGIQVVSASTAVQAVGGNATVEVDKSIATAYTTDSWAKVDFDGTKLTATVDRNTSRESRFTNVVIKASDNDSTIVSLSQLGLVFGYTDGNLVMSNNGGKAAKGVLANSTFSVAEAPDWISTTTTADSVYLDVAKNETGDMRRGLVCLESGEYRDTLYVTQASFDEGIAGDYRFYFYYCPIQNGQITGMQLTYTNASVYEFGSSKCISLDELGYIWDCEYDDENLMLTFPSAQQVGTYSRYYPVYQVLVNEDLQFNFDKTSIGAFVFDMEDVDGQPTKFGTFTGYMAGDDMGQTPEDITGTMPMGFLYVIAQGKPLSENSYMGMLYLFLQPTLIDVSNMQAAAKAAADMEARLTPTRKARYMKMAQAQLFAKHLSGNFDGEFPAVKIQK